MDAPQVTIVQPSRTPSYGSCGLWILLLLAVIVGGILLWVFVFKPKPATNSNSTASSFMSESARPVAVGTQPVASPAPAAFAPTGAPIAPVTNGAALPAPTLAGSLDTSYAPVGTVSANELLGQANCKNAYWDSSQFLPKASCAGPFGSISGDGQFSQLGPSFQELSVYTPNLLASTIASQHMMEPLQTRRGMSLDPRPTPPIVTGNRVSIPWGQSSLTVEDRLADFDAKLSTWNTGAC